MDSRIIRKEVIVPATREELWRAWTTSEGITSFFGRKAIIELRLDGPFEVLFLLDQPIGLQGSEGCKILSYFPMDYIEFTWNAPPGFAKRGEHTKVIVEIDRHDTLNYKVALTQLGIGEGEDWQKVYDYFNVAWEQVLEGLREYFVKKRKG